VLAKIRADGKPSVEVPEEFKTKCVLPFHHSSLVLRYRLTVLSRTGTANQILEAKEKEREKEKAKEEQRSEKPTRSRKKARRCVVVSLSLWFLSPLPCFIFLTRIFPTGPRALAQALALALAILTRIHHQILTHRVVRAPSPHAQENEIQRGGYQALVNAVGPSRHPAIVTQSRPIVVAEAGDNSTLHSALGLCHSDVVTCTFFNA